MPLKKSSKIYLTACKISYSTFSKVEAVRKERTCSINFSSLRHRQPILPVALAKMKVIVAGAFLSVFFISAQLVSGVKLRGFDDLSGAGDKPDVNGIGDEESVFLDGSMPQKYCDASYLHCKAFCGKLGRREFKMCQKTAGTDECKTKKRHVGLMCRKGCALSVKQCRKDVEAVTDADGNTDWSQLEFGAGHVRDGSKDSFEEFASDLDADGDESAETEETDFDHLVAGLELEEE